jgi:AAA15 family ATPase/GTPase
LISKISLENFKAIGKSVSLEIKPITILVGPNGSGKSSILEAIALMSQSVGTQLQLEGKLVKYPIQQAIFHKLDASKPMMFKVKINPPPIWGRDMEGLHLPGKIELRC